MLRMRPIAAVVASALALGACGTDTSPAESDSSSKPSFRTENRPQGPVCSVAPIANGTGTYANTDNDFIVSGQRANSFGFRIRGQVTDLGAEKHHVLVVVKRLISATHGLRTLVTKVSVN